MAVKKTAQKSSRRASLNIPVLIGITLFAIGVIFIISGVFIEQPLMNSENWFNFENAKLSRIYLGVFVGSVGLLVIGLMTPTYFFVGSCKEKQRISNAQMEKLTFFGVGEKAPTFSNISQEKVVAPEDEITDSRDEKEEDTPQIEEQPIKKTKKKEILKETPLYDDDDIEIIDSPVKDEDKQEESFYDDDDIEIVENAPENKETENVPLYNDDDIEIIDEPSQDEPIDDAPIYNDDDIEIVEEEPQSQNKEESFYNDDDIEIIDSPVQDEDKQENAFYDDDDIEILENAPKNEETEDVPLYNDDDIEIIDEPSKDEPIDDAPIYNDDDIEILD